MSPKAISARGCYSARNPRHRISGIPAAWAILKKGLLAMSKTLEAISEIIRSPKPPFRKVDDRPVKAQKHRYERRKVKEYIRLGDWAQENAS